MPSKPSDQIYGGALENDPSKLFLRLSSVNFVICH
jgi:hypothetical protein